MPSKGHIRGQLKNCLLVKSNNNNETILCLTWNASAETNYMGDIVGTTEKNNIQFKSSDKKKGGIHSLRVYIHEHIQCVWAAENEKIYENVALVFFCFF